MQYKVRNRLIPVPELHRKPILATLEMYDRSEDLADSPLIQSKINLTHMSVYKAMQSGVTEHQALLDRQRDFIAVYEDIKTNGYNNSIIWCWFDDDGNIRIYDGYHRLAILEHLNMNILVPVETEWTGGIDGQHKGKDFPLAEVLCKEPPEGQWLYQPVFDKRVENWEVARVNSSQRLEYILQNLVGKTVLDIGCSEGYFSREIAKQGYVVTAIDHSKGLVAAARYLSILDGVNIEYKHITDWKDFLENNGSYDNILFLSVLHNDMKTIGVDAGLKKLEAFRGKASKIFLEGPYYEWGEASGRHGFVGKPPFDFSAEESVERLSSALGSKVIAKWSPEPKSRPIYTFEDNRVFSAKVSVDDVPWWDLTKWVPDYRHQYWPLFNSLQYTPCRNIMEVGVHTGDNAVAMIKAAAQKVPEEEIHYFGFDLFEEESPEHASEEFSPAVTRRPALRPAVFMFPTTNFGDLLNVPILTHYLGEGVEFTHPAEIKPGRRIIVGIGTLVDYLTAPEWFIGKDITFMGTGSSKKDVKINIPAKGFVRGKLTEAKIGVKALGDIGILIDRVFGAPNTERDKTGIVLDKTEKDVQIDLPDQDRFTAQGISASQLLGVYLRIARCKYIITDRLHVASTAEALHIPWIIWNHGDGDLKRTPDKFADWAGMIGKERFVIKDMADFGIIKENTDFSASEEQKDILEAAIQEINQVLAPRSLKTVDAKIKRLTKAKASLFKGNTRETLPDVVNTLPKMDLIYIDGGHSIETTRNDWKYAQQLMDSHTVVYFDDYNDEMPFIGPHFVVGELPPKYQAEVLPNTSYYKRPYGRQKCQLLRVTMRRPASKIKTEHFRFHLIGLPHSKTVKDWGPCAFTQLVYRFSKMLTDMGHEVYHYGTEGSNPSCTEQVDVLTEAVQKQAYGNWNPWKQLWIHNGKDLAYTTFRKNAIAEIQRRKEPGDILLISNGNWLKEISDVAGGGMATVEPFVGYLGFYAKYKVFPSYAWMHHMYGKTSRSGMSENFVTGNWYDAVIPHFFDPADHTYEEKKDDYFLYLGRLIQRKGVHIAVELCKRIGAKLIVVGQPMWPDDIEKSLSLVGANQPHVEYINVTSFKQSDRIRSKAKAAIIPSLYMEPFGLVVPEALLSGTPVITTDWGSFPEIVKQGEVGYRCRTMDDFIWAANNIDKISPAACREYAIANYSMERISKCYQEYFMKVHDLFGKGWYAEHTDREELDWLRKY